MKPPSHNLLPTAVRGSGPCLVGRTGSAIYGLVQVLVLSHGSKRGIMSSEFCPRWIDLLPTKKQSTLWGVISPCNDNGILMSVPYHTATVTNAEDGTRVSTLSSRTALKKYLLIIEKIHRVT